MYNVHFSRKRKFQCFLKKYLIVSKLRNVIISRIWLFQKLPDCFKYLIISKSDYFKYLTISWKIWYFTNLIVSSIWLFWISDYLLKNLMFQGKITIDDNSHSSSTFYFSSEVLKLRNVVVGVMFITSGHCSTNLWYRSCHLHLLLLSKLPLLVFSNDHHSSQSLLFLLLF